MRRILSWVLRVVLVLVLAIGAVGIWKQEEIKRLWAVRTLFLEDHIVGNFSNMRAAFLSMGVPRGNGPTAELLYGPETDLPASVAPWVEARDVTALVVLKDGEIVFEEYYKGTGPDDLRIGWSIAKSFLSVLVGQLIEDGTIESLDVPVTQYAPALKGGAYDGASLRDVLQMSSGVVFGEDVLDQSSDINRMGRVLALGGEMDDFAAGLTETFVAPGTQWEYTSIDTHVVGMVVRGATGRPIAELLSERVVAPLGLEHTPYYLTDGVGTAFVLGGLNLSTRDYARFGQMIAQGGAWQGQQIVSEEWIDASTQPSAPTAPGETGYGYHWWIPVGAAEGEFMARGFYGQYIYIDRRRGVVIAINAADRNFSDEGVANVNVAIFREIAQSL